MKTLICWAHGIGDTIMLTPSLKQYRASRPDSQIGLAYSRRIHADELRIPYVDEYFDLSDAWMDFNENFEQGMRCIVNESKAIAKTHGYGEVEVITMRSERAHRMDKIADCLGLNGVGYETEVIFGKSFIDDVKEKLNRDRIVCLHYRGGASKLWKLDEAKKFIERMQDRFGFIVLEQHTGYSWAGEYENRVGEVYSTASRNHKLGDVAATIKDCDLFVGVDSGPSWLAHCTDTPMITLFQNTRMHETAPLRERSYIVASKQAQLNCKPEFMEENEKRITWADALGDEIDAETVTETADKLWTIETTRSN